MTDLDMMVAGYIECALWAGLDWPSDGSEPEPLDANYSEDDISEEALATIREKCEAFATECSSLLAKWDRSDDYVGHDFYLNRNGHGAGFWDRHSSSTELGRIGDELSNRCKPYGESELYVGDDGKLYLP